MGITGDPKTLDTSLSRYIAASEDVRSETVVDITVDEQAVYDRMMLDRDSSGGSYEAPEIEISVTDNGPFSIAASRLETRLIEQITKEVAASEVYDRYIKGTDDGREVARLIATLINRSLSKPTGGMKVHEQVESILVKAHGSVIHKIIGGGSP